MADKKVIAESDVTAQQMKEFWSQVASGKINRQNLQMFMEERRFFEPNNFFVIRNGLWISLNFRNYILSVAEKILPIQLPSHIPGFDLP
ncbi:hypothetical protein L6261_01675, partial [Candidatus Parcubacteria bacterium]|nr:hypothetical protein [Candidatus Parcubacteria bacterium]